MRSSGLPPCLGRRLIGRPWKPSFPRPAIPNIASRRWPAASSPRWNWRGRAGCKSNRKRPSLTCSFGKQWPNGDLHPQVAWRPLVMDEFQRAVEAAVFASESPLSVEDIAGYVGEGDVEAALASLAERYAGHGIELVERGGRWHFQTAPDLAHILRRTREDTRRLARAAP